MPVLISALALVVLVQVLATTPARADTRVEGFDHDRIESWATQTFNDMLAAGQISGAVLSVVHGNEVILAKGYGVSSVVSGDPADGEATRVRIGSITKTFTASLVAMLIRDGLIGSVDDVANIYLKRIQLPSNDGVPITIRHLLTHTAGFEDRFFHIGAIDPVTVPATPDMIETLRPAFVRPAGERVVYSNYGVAVLGWLLEDLTGKPMAQLMAEKLFSPLQMGRTELVTNVNAPADLAEPGLLDGNVVVGPVPFVAINPAVAQTGSIVSTASDMGRFMAALLNEAEFGDGLTSRLSTPLAGNAEGMAQLGMVLFLDQWAGREILSHGGNWAGFHSWMVLVPEERVGIFVTLLSEAQPPGVVERFMSTLFPARFGAPSPAALSALPVVQSFLGEWLGPRQERFPDAGGSERDYVALAGYYRADRRPFRSAEALSSLVYFGAEVIEVTADAEGLYVGGVGPWTPTSEARYFLDVPSRPRIAFRKAKDGSHVLVPDIGIYTFTRIAPLAHPGLHAIILHLLVLLTLTGLFALRGITRNRRKLAPVSVGFAGLVMVVSTFGFLPEGHTMMNGYFVGEPARVVIFTTAANLLAVASVICLLVQWPRGGRRAHGPTLVLATIGIVIAVLLWPYNVIGPVRI